MGVDLAYCLVVLGVMPEQAAAFDRVADADLQRGVDRAHREQCNEHRGDARRPSVGNAGDAAQHALQSPLEAARLSTLADQLDDVLRCRPGSQQDRAQTDTGDRSTLWSGKWGSVCVEPV